MALLQAVVLGLIALIVTPGYLFYFDVTPKVAVLMLGAAAALVVAAAGAAPVSRSRPMTWFSALLALNLVSLCVSAALSANPALSFFGTNWRRFGVLEQASLLVFAWLVARTVAGQVAKARIILRGLALAGLLAGVYGIFQYFGWDPLLPAAAYHIGEGIWTIVRPPGTLGYVSYFATWLVVTVFLSLALAESENSAPWRALAYVSAAVSLVAMLMTGTRAAMLGLAAGAAVWFCSRGFRISRRWAAAGAVVALAGAAFYFSPAGWNLRSRARWYSEDSSGGGRVLLWRDSARMAAQRPLAGYGPEVFNAGFPKFESRELAQAYPDFLHESPHNMFLDALVAQGWPGLIILAGIFGLSLAAGLGRQTSGTQRLLACALMAGAVSQQFTVFTLPTAVILYVTAALLVGLKSQPGTSRRRIALLAPAAIVAATMVAAAVIAAGLVYCALRLTVADHALAMARRAVEARNGVAAAADYSNYEKWRFAGTSADLWYSRAMISLAQKTPNPVLRVQALTQAGAAAIRATETAEDPANAWYNVSQLYAAQNDPAGTERGLRAAIGASPNWFKPHWMLAQVLLLQSRLDDAEREAALAVELDGGKNAEVSNTLRDIRARRKQVSWRPGGKPLH